MSVSARSEPRSLAAGGVRSRPGGRGYPSHHGGTPHSLSVPRTRRGPRPGVRDARRMACCLRRDPVASESGSRAWARPGPSGPGPPPPQRSAGAAPASAQQAERGARGPGCGRAGAGKSQAGPWVSARALSDPLPPRGRARALPLPRGRAGRDPRAPSRPAQSGPGQPSASFLCCNRLVLSPSLCAHTPPFAAACGGRYPRYLGCFQTSQARYPA